MSKTTVFCAVWSKDENRYALLEQHQENLRNQSVAVDVVYVFDDNDQPPGFLNGTKIISSKPLTIYEAWNLALAACRTTFVMNLNLDDRLNKNAIELLEIKIQQESAALIGGDWKICYSQNEVNDVAECYSADVLPFSSIWPPQKGMKTRLGSGTGNRQTYGPATLWRLDAHIQAPRYPYRTVDGEMIAGIGDAIWWNILSRHLRLKMVRLPVIIGNYFSHPEGQAEFRYGSEGMRIAGKNISLI